MIRNSIVKERPQTCMQLKTVYINYSAKASDNWDMFFAVFIKHNSTL